jgi:argininosuccinate lyase
MKNKKVVKLWGKAFEKEPKKQALLFAASRDVKGLPAADEVLIPFEIKASLAWVKGLYEQKLIKKSEAEKLVKGLKKLKKLYKKGEFMLDPLKEDVHSDIEAFLIKELGIDVGGKVHTGRSRTEQGIVDILLYIKTVNDEFKKDIKGLIKVLEKAAKKYAKTLIPGYTHFQHATVTTFGQMLSAYTSVFKKDLVKFLSWSKLEEVNPLGSGAGYGTTLAVDKKKINKHLGLKHVFANEIAAASFKGDAEMQIVFNLAVFLNHLSSLAQTLIIFSTKEFGFVTIADEYSTGSSIMPQKKNPDPLEVIKAKASMCHGYLVSLLSLTKASFIGYGRDMQWSKYLVMDAFNEASLAPQIMAGIIKTLKVNSKAMAKHTKKGFILSQAVMEGLIKDYNLPMRLAKLCLEETVKKCQDKGGLDFKVLTSVLKENQLSIKVSKKDFIKWTNPAKIASLQAKKGGEKL